MAQEDFDDFKQRLREWMEKHPAKHDWFEVQMNRKDDTGYQMVFMQAVALISEYKKVINKRINSVPKGDISDIEQFFTKNKLAEKLIAKYH